MEELKKKLILIRKQILIRNELINGILQDLNRNKIECVELKRLYKSTDRELAREDGRYKIIPFGVSGIKKKEKSLAQQLKHLSDDQRRSLLMQLMA